MINQKTLERLQLSNIAPSEIEKLIRFTDAINAGESYCTLLAEGLILLGNFDELDDLLSSEEVSMEDFIWKHSSKRLASILREIADYRKIKEELGSQIDSVPTVKLMCALENGYTKFNIIKKMMLDFEVTRNDMDDAIALNRISKEANVSRFLALAPYTRKSVLSYMKANEVTMEEAISKRNRDTYTYDQDIINFYASQADLQKIKFGIRSKLMKKAISEGVSTTDIEWADPLYSEIEDLAKILEGLARGYSKKELMFFKLYSESLTDEQLDEVLIDISRGYALVDLLNKYERESVLEF